MPAVPHRLRDADLPPPHSARDRILPLVVFAAGRDRFEFVVRGFANSIEAKILVFRHLPLEENGWLRCNAKVRHLRNEPQGMVFLVERT